MRKDEPATKSDIAAVKSDVRAIKGDLKRLAMRVDAVEVDVRHNSFLIEDMGTKLDALIDVIKEMRGEMATKADIAEMRAEQELFRKTLTATNVQVTDHEHRITHLEARPV